MAKGDWEIYHIKYHTPKFGTEGKEFNPDQILFMVSTNKGMNDAKAAFEKFHPGCKVDSILTHKDALIDDACDGMITKSIVFKKKKK